MAAKAGIDLDTLARIVPVSAGQSRTFDNIPRGVLNRSFAAGGTLDIVAKDMDLAVALAREVGAPGSLGALALDVYKRAQAQGWGGEGFPVVARCSKRWRGRNSNRANSRPAIAPRLPPFAAGTVPTDAALNRAYGPLASPVSRSSVPRKAGFARSVAFAV